MIKEAECTILVQRNNLLHEICYDDAKWLNYGCGKQSFLDAKGLQAKCMGSGKVS